MASINANSITLEVVEHGQRGNPAMLLVRGLGSQLIHWPASLIDGFVAAGFHVITFDNRDTGLSQKFGAAGRPDIPALQAAMLAGEDLDVPYTMRDMAGDALGVLDALEIEKAHVLGMSMGGMIVQTLALEHADRLLSATIVMSSSGAPDLPPAAPEVWELLLSEPESNAREAVIAHTLICDRAWYSPKHPFDPEARRDLIGRAYDRCYYPEGLDRQYAAILSGRGRHEALSGIDLPVLVIHGSHDTLLPPEHGRDLAERIPGAGLVEIDGMGHDLEGGVPAIVVDHVTRLVRGA